MFISVLTLALAVAMPLPDDMIKIATFDNGDDTTWNWHEVNDPVMGGLSTATFKVDEVNKVGVFNGTCRVVPSLKAPGFCNAETENILKKAKDISTYFHDTLLIHARSNIAYDGFKISLAADTLNPQFASYKANFQIAPSTDFTTIAIPFNKFSNDWSPFTGNCDTIDPTGKAHKCCNTTYPEVCLKSENLKDITQIGIWAEGAAGAFHLEVAWIAGGTASSLAALKKDFPSVCSGPVQAPLKFNMSTIPSDMPGPPDETLGDAICCDPNNAAYAEPAGTFSTVKLFSQLSSTGLNTFYDSVCGIPLFEAPKGRNFSDWQSETQEHGWPSFRDEELIKENVIINKTTSEVKSKCGTHLGTWFQDTVGDRYCIDLVCISGSQKIF